MSRKNERNNLFGFGEIFCDSWEMFSDSVLFGCYHVSKWIEDIFVAADLGEGVELVFLVVEVDFVGGADGLGSCGMLIEMVGSNDDDSFGVVVRVSFVFEECVELVNFFGSKHKVRDDSEVRISGGGIVSPKRNAQSN
jgi:hypothetical protein